MFRGNVKISMSHKKNLIPFVSLLPPPQQKTRVTKNRKCMFVSTKDFESKIKQQIRPK